MNTDTLDRIEQRAIFALRTGTPFSAIRLGDGEGRLLAWPGRITRPELDNRLCYWFGHADLTDLEALMLKVDLMRAMFGADVVGCYQGEERNRWWREAATRVALLRTYKPEVMLAGNDLHRELWASGGLDRIIAEASRVVLVTCRDVCDRFQERYGQAPDWIVVPEEAHASGQINDHWQLYQGGYKTAIVKRIKPGVLTLVGAGVLGKVYCHAVKMAGGVALDIGSIFDGWAGRLDTRSYLGRKGGWRL